MDFRKLREEVAERKTLDDSIIAALAGYAEAVREAAAAKASQAELNAIADDMDAMNARIAGAIVANTPAAELPVQPQPVEPGTAPVPAEPVASGEDGHTGTDHAGEGGQPASDFHRE